MHEDMKTELTDFVKSSKLVGEGVYMVKQQSNCVEEDRGVVNPHTRRDDGYVVGLDLGGTNLRLLLADLEGKPLCRVGRPIDMRSDPHDVVETAAAYIVDLARSEGLSMSGFRGLGAGIPGITNVETGVVKAAPFLTKWNDVPFRAMLEQRLRVPICIDNDVNLAAIGEGYAGIARGERDYVFLAIGTGLGAGIVLRGELYHGSDWASGEVGYLRICCACDTPSDTNQPGPLESLVGGPGIERAWRTKIAGTNLDVNLSATEIFELAGSMVAATELLSRVSSLLADAIINISLVLNCPLFVLGGGVGGSVPLLKSVTAKLAQNNIVKPRLEASSLGTDAQLYGAVRLALESLRANED
jgi:glucokinase